MVKRWTICAVVAIVSGCALIDAAQGPDDDDNNVVKIDTNNDDNNTENNENNENNGPNYTPITCGFVDCDCIYDGCDPAVDCEPAPECSDCIDASHCRGGYACGVDNVCLGCRQWDAEFQAFGFDFYDASGVTYSCVISDDPVCIRTDC